MWTGGKGRGTECDLCDQGQKRQPGRAQSRACSSFLPPSSGLSPRFPATLFVDASSPFP